MAAQPEYQVYIIRSLLPRPDKYMMQIPSRAAHMATPIFPFNASPPIALDNPPDPHKHPKTPNISLRQPIHRRQSFPLKPLILAFPSAFPQVLANHCPRRPHDVDVHQRSAPPLTHAQPASSSTTHKPRRKPLTHIIARYPMGFQGPLCFFNLLPV